MTIEAAPKPIIKWAGGKQALVPQLLEHFPEQFECYYEPFLGGASVALAVGARRARLSSEGVQRAESQHAESSRTEFQRAESPRAESQFAESQRAVLSDANAWLIDTYRAIRDEPAAVAEVLEALPNTKEDFLRVRALAQEELTLVQRAAHFVYLNKTCFRGLFRVNRQGRFNVPYGDYQRRYFDPANLRAVSAFLARADLRCGDFGDAVADAKSGDFVYFDPPYYKVGGTADFNRYTAGQFREDDQERLAALCRELDARGVRWALSNSDTEYVRELYAGFVVHELSARREINLNSQNRNVVELLISNETSA